MSDYTIVGCGDIGLRVAKELLSQGHSVQATVHFGDGAGTLAKLGIAPVVANFDYQEEVPELVNKIIIAFLARSLKNYYEH